MIQVAEATKMYGEGVISKALQRDVGRLSGKVTADMGKIVKLLCVGKLLHFYSKKIIVYAKEKIVSALRELGVQIHVKQNVNATDMMRTIY